MEVSYSLLEDGRIGVRYCVSDLLFGCVWAHNAVLALGSSLRIPSEIRLERLVLVDGRLESAVDLADLWGISWVAGVGLRLNCFYACHEATVPRHDLGAEVVDFARGHVWPRQRLLEHSVEVAELGIEVVEGAVDLAAFVEDGIGVRACATTVGLHLYIACIVLDTCRECSAS